MSTVTKSVPMSVLATLPRGSRIGLLVSLAGFVLNLIGAVGNGLGWSTVLCAFLGGAAAALLVRHYAAARQINSALAEDDQ